MLRVIKDLCDTYGYASTLLLKPNQAERVLLSRLVKKGLIKRISKGLYVITDKGLEYLSTKE